MELLKDDASAEDGVDDDGASEDGRDLGHVKVLERVVEEEELADDGEGREDDEDVSEWVLEVRVIVVI